MVKKIKNNCTKVLKRSALFLCMILLLVNCKSKYDDCTEQDYADCITEKPETGRIKVLLTINSENRFIPVNVYEGDFENGELLRSDTITMRTFHYNLTPEKDYSFTATYKDGNSTIMAIDGGRITISRYRMCELRCYDLNAPEIDLRLR